MTTRYKIVTAQDGIHWVSLQPLLEDIKEQMDKPEIKENTHFITSLQYVKALVESLIREGEVQVYSAKERDPEPSYKETLQ